VQEEGWYVDPYELHEARWISAGVPTALIRDGQSESTDVPPTPGYKGPLTPFAEIRQQTAADRNRPGLLANLVDVLTSIWPF
jgi:hypothetical protein